MSVERLPSVLKKTCEHTYYAHRERHAQNVICDPVRKPPAAAEPIAAFAALLTREHGKRGPDQRGAAKPAEQARVEEPPSSWPSDLAVRRVLVGAVRVLVPSDQRPEDAYGTATYHVSTRK